MTLTIHLMKDEGTRLAALAAQHGRDVQTYAHAALFRENPNAKEFLVLPTENGVTKRAPNTALETALNAWLHTDMTIDPDEIAQAQADLGVWKQTLNASRAESGERLLFS